MGKVSTFYNSFSETEFKSMDQHPLYKPYGQILDVMVLIPVKVVTKFWRNVAASTSG
jgi:hypothetical protein